MTVATGCRSCIQAGQGQRLRNQHGVHQRRDAERNRKPENGADQHQQRGARRQRPAGPEHPRHSVFEGVMHGLLERLVADLLAQPRPVLADRLRARPRGASPPTGRSRTMPLSSAAMPSPTMRSVNSGNRITCSRIGNEKIDDIDQNEERASQHAPDGERNRHQRHDHDVIDADPEAARQSGRRAVSLSWLLNARPSWHAPHCMPRWSFERSPITGIIAQ